MNQFLQDNRIASVRQDIIHTEDKPLLVFVVETISSNPLAPSKSTGGSKSKGTDYSKILEREEHLVYSRLREARKDWAKADGGPLYNIFGNDELAQMVMKRVRPLTDLAKIPGVGEMRIKKYGAEILKIISELPDKKKDTPPKDDSKGPADH